MLPKEKEINKSSKQPWLVNVLIAMSILIAMLGVVTFLYGNEVIERPILALFILLAWVGTLVGLKIPGGPGRQ